MPFLFFLYLRGKERIETAKEKKESTLFLLVSSILIDSNKICHSESVENKDLARIFQAIQNLPN